VFLVRFPRVFVLAVATTLSTAPESARAGDSEPLSLLVLESERDNPAEGIGRLFEAMTRDFVSPVVIEATPVARIVSEIADGRRTACAVLQPTDETLRNGVRVVEILRYTLALAARDGAPDFPAPGDRVAVLARSAGERTAIENGYPTAPSRRRENILAMIQAGHVKYWIEAREVLSRWAIDARHAPIRVTRVFQPIENWVICTAEVSQSRILALRAGWSRVARSGEARAIFDRWSIGDLMVDPGPLDERGAGM